MGIILILILSFLAIYFYSKLNKLKNELKTKDAKVNELTAKNSLLETQIQSVNREKSNLQTTNHGLNDKIAELSKYQNIIDVKIECEYLLKKAQKDYEKLRERGNQELLEAQDNARESRKNVKELTEKKQREIELLYENAVRESKRIIENAENKAETIGGDAYRSLREANEITDRIQAMKNVIKGYGNEYLVPNYTLLDQLAEDFSHKEAGENLKKLRQNNKMMIVNRQAGICDYVDRERQLTAVDFVIDAYNGKVDSILATVRKDNYGILKQKIEDAFQLVNFNGKAFRNARISEIYHQARLEELKWAVVAQELRAMDLKSKEKSGNRSVKKKRLAENLKKR